MKFENLFWWQYKPTDEREKELYAKAYSRAFKTVVFLGLASSLFLAGQTFTIQGSVLSLIFIVIITIGYIAGWTVVKDEDLSLQRTTQLGGEKMMPRDTVVLKATMPALSMCFALYVLVMLSWPTTVVAATVLFFVLSRILLSISAFSTTKHFESPIRWFLVIILPLTAILFGRMKTRNVVGFIGSILLAIGLYGVVTVAPIAAIRSIVSPLIITTSAFAPDLPNGAYRFVDERQFAAINVNDYVVLQTDGRWIVGHVTAVTGDTYTIKTTSTEEHVTRAEITGRIMNQTSWFTAFVETQMPK